MGKQIDKTEMRNKKFTFIYIVYVGCREVVVGEAHAATLHTWRSEDNFQELVLSFNHMDLGN